MSSGPVKWVLVHLNDWTWFVAEYRVWLIVLVTVIGGVLPLLSAARKRLPGTAPSRVIRSAATALALSSAAVAICSLLHFSDLRWLPVNQRGSLHVSAPGGLFGFTKPAVTVINSVAGLPAEWRATQVAVHTAIVCAFLAMAGIVVMLLAWRRARRADIRQIVQEEIRKATVVTQLCGSGNNRLPVMEGPRAGARGIPLRRLTCFPARARCLCRPGARGADVGRRPGQRMIHLPETHSAEFLTGYHRPNTQR